MPNPVTSRALDVETDVLKDKNASPNFESARTMEICVLLEFVGRTWACVKTLWTAMVSDLPLARKDLKLLLSAERRR